MCFEAAVLHSQAVSKSMPSLLAVVAVIKQKDLAELSGMASYT